MWRCSAKGGRGKGIQTIFTFEMWLCSALACRIELIALRQQKKEQELIEAARNRLHHNVLAIALANKLARGRSSLLPCHSG